MRHRPKILRELNLPARVHTPDEVKWFEDHVSYLYNKYAECGLIPEFLSEIKRRAEEEDKESVERLRYLKNNLLRANNRQHKKEISIDVSYLYIIGEKQDWKCALSGVALEFSRGGQIWDGKWSNPNSCSIDRIDSSKGYIENNIQLVTWKINKTKGSMKNQEFIDMCIHVAGTHKLPVLS